MIGRPPRSTLTDTRLPYTTLFRSTIARVVGVGRSSMQVEVELVAEDLLSGEREQCTRGRFVMIALHARGRPAPVPALPTGCHRLPPSATPTGHPLHVRGRLGAFYAQRHRHATNPPPPPPSARPPSP